MGDTVTVPKVTTEITEAAVKSIVGWIGRHALPVTLAYPSPEYTTGLALDRAVIWAAAHLKQRLPLQDGDPVSRDVVRDDWNLLVTVAQTWANEPEYPGWGEVVYHTHDRLAAQAQMLRRAQAADSATEQ